MNEHTLLRLWGKTDKKNPHNYHPLLFHLLDVGHVYQILWRTALPARVKQRIADVLGLDVETAERLTTLVAAQHDLGKASAFQGKDAGLWRVINEHGLTISNRQDRPHGYVSSKALPSMAAQGIGGWQASRRVARALAKITGGHHGTFPTSADLSGIRGQTLGGDDWEKAREALLRALARALFGDDPEGVPPLLCPLEELTDPAIVPLLGGLISVADWIGSSHHFLPAGPVPVAQYVVLSRQRAVEAVEDFGWGAVPRFAAPAPFGHIFRDAEGRPYVPNAMQKKVTTLTDAAAGPYLLIIEAAMGDGKTEAALYATDRGLTTGTAQGFYIGLPTQATGNAMFDRVHKYLTERGHAGTLNLQLVHASALLSESFEALRKAADALRNADIYDDAEEADASAEAQAGRVVAEGWFAARKRPLLARFGAGTIDQSLLGVLQTRHWFVRLLGLAGKVVIFDEVHAYDVYMSALLGSLLRWLRALDCTVILLSATLPTASRDALVEAWHGGQASLQPADYPRLTFCPAGGEPQALPVCGSEAEQKPSEPHKVFLAWTACDWHSVLMRLRNDLPAGGCALLLCNTVTRAQDAFRTLRPTLEADGWDVRLFHARTPAGWRQERETWVLNTFGKASPLDRRNAKILLIASQVVEQSLDLDFDWIATEMAPGDLLLQRMGRQWRHPNRLRATETRRFVILCGEEANGLPRFPDFADLIYERYILLRSWLVMKACGETFTLPTDIDQLVQDVYATTLPEGPSEAWQAALTASLAEMKRQREKDKDKADLRTLPEPSKGIETILDPGSTLDHVRVKLWDDDDPRIHEDVRAATRLGDPSIGVICAGTGEDGQALAALRSGEPTLEDARALLRFGLPLSQRGLYHILVNQKPPSAWQNNSLLRYHRVVTFEKGHATLPPYHLRLSREEGLVIEKEAKETEE